MGNSIVVVGAQWGDEGKGKIVDFLSESSDIVVRFNGGNNAGHTVKVGDQTFKFHLLPSGVARDKLSVLANGLVVDPKVLIDEIESVKKLGHTPHITISEKAHVIMDYHKHFDAGRENTRSNKIGTTKRGIGPTYSDKARRSEALRMADLVGPKFREKLNSILNSKKQDLLRFGIVKTDDDFEKYKKDVFFEYSKYADILRSHVSDTTVLINEAIDSGKNILFEGAQGTLLDVDHGTYPYVTSSNSCAGGVCTGAGVGPNRVKRITGIVKAYTTRVGEGPFPTELHNEDGENLRKTGCEFGTTTGRPRRCGWLDLVILRYSKMLNGLTDFALTKLDVLTGMKKIKICVSYDIDGRRTEYFPSSADDLDKAKPVYIEMEGWEKIDEESVKKNGYDALPEQAKRYIERIENNMGIPASMISYGPERSKTIMR